MTDYESYAAVWSCQRILGIGHRESAQIMSRTPDMSREVIQKLRKRFESFGINEHYFSIINHDKCGWNDHKRNDNDAVTLNNKSFSLRVGPLEVAA